MQTQHNHIPNQQRLSVGEWVIALANPAIGFFGMYLFAPLLDIPILGVILGFLWVLGHLITPVLILLQHRHFAAYFQWASLPPPLISGIFFIIGGLSPQPENPNPFVSLSEVADFGTIIVMMGIVGLINFLLMIWFSRYLMYRANTI